MEHKKLLLVTISVGLFFVIVIGTALVFLRTDETISSVGASTAYAPVVENRSFYSAGSSGADVGRAGTGITDTSRTDTGTVGVSSDAEPARDLSANGANGGDSAALNESVPAISGDTPERQSSSAVVFTVDPREAAGVPAEPVQRRQSASAATPASPSVASGSSSSAKTPSSGAVSRSQPQPQAQSQPSTAARTTAPAKTKDAYWVQAGAFTAMSRAETVKQTLADKGITSIIDNNNVGNTLYFRVRVGPYASQKEANYWLELIKAMNGFENSQVRTTQTTL